MQSQASSSNPSHCLKISMRFGENCDQNCGSKVFRKEKKMALAKRSLIASTPYAILCEFKPPFTLSENFMAIRGKLRPESWIKGFQRRKKMALAKRSLIASASYAIPSKFEPPFTLSGNFMVIRKKLRPESCVKGFQGRKTNWRSRNAL